MLNKSGLSLRSYMVFGLFLFIFQIASASAGDLAISGIEVASLAGNKLQIQVEMTGAAVEPKVFHTDNPARIALDFSGVKNALDKKLIQVNQGAASSIYVAEAADRVRVVVNLTESTPFETKVVDNKVLLTLTRANTLTSAKFTPPAKRASVPFSARSERSTVRALIPEQTISGFDFKRGDKGEGRILVSLANPNTIINSKQEGGKVVISLLNTQLPENLTKRLDVSEFATPVKFIDTLSSSQQATVTVTTQNDLYDYSLFQSEGLLTIEFRPLSNEEKEALDRTRVKYKGDRLSLNFQEIEIRSVIAILAEFTGQNVVAGDDVTGSITLKLDDVPWDEALDFIMLTKGLEKFDSGTVTLIAPSGKIKDYKKQQQETAAVIERLDPLVTEYIKINYARAENFRNLLNGSDTGAFGSCGVGNTSSSSSSSSTSASSAGRGGSQGGNQGSSQGGNQGNSQQGGNQGSSQGGKNDEFRILSSRGSVVVDARTNTLIVRETTTRLEEAKKLIRKLDVPVRQVMIESRIVFATNTFLKELGVRFGVGKQANDIGGGKNFALGGRGTQGNINGGTTVSDQLVNLATIGNPYGALGATLARGADYVLNLELTALQNEGRAELISNPRVMTTDRCLATIRQGVQLPFPSGSSPTTPANITFIDAVLELEVTPQITPSDTVIMNLRISNDTPGAVTNNGVGIDTQRLETNVQVLDGETVVLGGVFGNNLRNDTNKVPFFADLPGIGFLFKRTNKIDDKRELLIFVTPKIIANNTASN